MQFQTKIIEKNKTMRKMKSALYISVIFALSLAACTKPLPETELPAVDNGAITMVKATIAPLTLQGVEGEGVYAWSETHKIGIYGTQAGNNECYLPVKATIGDNEAFFFGNTVAGDLLFYMPYSKEGSATAFDYRVTIPAVQKYYESPFDHMMYNSTFLATAVDSSNALFDYHAGLVKVQLKHDLTNVTSVNVSVGNLTAEAGYDDNCVGDISIFEGTTPMLTNGAGRVTIAELGDFSTSEAEPKTIWAMLAPGNYENLVVEIVTNDVTIISPVKGPFVVEKCAVCERVCVAEQIDYDNQVPGFEGENGEFNPKE